MSRISGLRNLVGLGLNKPLNPLTGAFLGQTVVAPVGRAIRDDLTGARIKEEEFRRNAMKKTELLGSLRRAYAQRQQMLTNSNLQFLKQNAPEVYDSVMAGRRLPEDAIVLGGQPRRDLLEELTRNMGSYQGPTSSPF